ncbi:GNAT family N-acetyltransferase [Roseateles chitinivorans]|uniref:GNAT family N-acetyltransferase n=1 Tax=Roseateles chitinivorans TaxID=2917965 RepID=UPI003D663D09
MNALVTLTSVAPADAQLLDNLWQFYELESSFWSGEDIDADGRFNSLSGFLERLGAPDAEQWGYLLHHDGQVAGLLLIGLQQLQERTIKEFADLYVLPKYRGLGIASEVLRQTVMASDHPWLICVFRDDRKALRFWERAFERLPFSSVRELLSQEYPDLREFIVNDPNHLHAAMA